MNLLSNIPSPKHRYNLALTVITWLSIVLGQHLYHLKAPQIGPELAIEKYAILFIILWVFSYSKNRFLRFLSLSFIPLFSFFQWAHLSYYGTRIFPHEIWLTFTQAGEIAGTLKEELYHLAYPMALTFPIIGLLFWLNRSWNTSLKKIPMISFLFIFYFAYNPARTYITGNTWGRQPSVQEFDGVSAYLSLSYFLGRILPAKIEDTKKKTKLELAYTLKEPAGVNVLFVLGESLTPNHMSLYGYDRPTTPFFGVA